MPNITNIEFYTLNLGSMEASGSSTSAAVDLRTYDIQHRFSVQSTVTAAGADDPEYKIEYLASNDGSNFVAAAGGSEITTGQGKGTIIPTAFTPPLCGWLKLKVTETGGAKGITGCILTLAVQ
jgi:hypothetical protein